jgi:hypothetical protein
VTTIGVRRADTRERSIIIGLAVGVATLVALYVGLRSSVLDGGANGTLMPYQMLVRDLVSADQATFNRLRDSLLEAESVRAQAGRWPEATTVGALPGGGPGEGPTYKWVRTQQNFVVNYLGLPEGDVSAPAWLIRVQEPDPATPTDSAPNDEEHHRLPDKTVLHVSIWTHRFGGQVPPDFLVKPENAGWTQLLTAPVNPVVAPKK